MRSQKRRRASPHTVSADLKIAARTSRELELRSALDQDTRGKYSSLVAGFLHCQAAHRAEQESGSTPEVIGRESGRCTIRNTLRSARIGVTFARGNVSRVFFSYSELCWQHRSG